MKLKLIKPLVFLDLETTGTSITEDRICEISLLKILPPSGVKKEVYECRVNPGIPIPEGASKVHGITNESVADELTFTLIAHEVHKFIEDSDIAGFNSNSFDVPLLYNEFKRAGIKWYWKESSLVDVGNIFKIKESRSLSAAYLFYCDKRLENAHQAAADVEATKEVFFKQLEKYAEDETFSQLDTIPKLAFFSNFNRDIVDITGFFKRNEQGEIVFAKGRNANKIAKNEHSYLNWMLTKAAGFDEDIKDVVKVLLYGKGNTNPKLKQNNNSSGNKMF